MTPQRPGKGVVRHHLIAWFSAVMALTASYGFGLAAGCEANPDAIGTSRVLSVDPRALHRIGSKQYPEVLPLQDHEVVLTFDDGPLPPYTESVLNTLASNCVKATFFIIGEMARHSPDLVRRAYDEGHTIGTHTQTHPNLSKLSSSHAKREIEDGIASVAAVLTASRRLAPFFRAPYLAVTPTLQNYLVSRGLMLWGIDFQADDWEKISPDEVVERALKAIEKKRKGVLLLHDIHSRTAAALPKLLTELKARGYKIVHVVPNQ